MSATQMIELEEVIIEKDLAKYTGLRKTQIAKKVDDGTFPPPIKLSARRRAWLKSEIISWQVQQIQRSRGDKRGGRAG
jgi:predicted DNA-binding transcriptional regulator AlpA